jgi:hypothetical protein
MSELEVLIDEVIDELRELRGLLEELSEFML